jgi:DNA-binding PadR family transcriptional regulator
MTSETMRGPWSTGGAKGRRRGEEATDDTRGQDERRSDGRGRGQGRGRDKDFSGWLAHFGAESGRRGHRRRGGPGGFGPGGPGGFGPGGWGPGGPGGFGGPPFGRSGPYRRGPKVRRGDVRAAALALLAEEPRNGYQIIQEIGERSGGIWRPSPGSVYPALQQLEDEGLIQAEKVDGRKQFRLTDEGRTYVESHQAETRAPWETVGENMDAGMFALRDQFFQVAAAAFQVAHAGSPAQIEAAQGVLASARRDLYRILADGDEAGGGGETDDAGGSE